LLGPGAARAARNASQMNRMHEVDIGFAEHGIVHTVALAMQRGRGKMAWSWCGPLLTSGSALKGFEVTTQKEQAREPDPVDPDHPNLDAAMSTAKLTTSLV
jgi:hypothetical protein